MVKSPHSFGNAHIQAAWAFLMSESQSSAPPPPPKSEIDTPPCHIFTIAAYTCSSKYMSLVLNPISLRMAKIL